ncbi:MAG: lipoprotein [Betaproteobacteria bacterium]
MKKMSERLARILGLERSISACLALMLLAACGQKGALYLPAPLPGPMVKPGASDPAKPKAEPAPSSSSP